MNVTYIIVTCDANKHRLDACTRTWAKDVKLVVVGSDWHDSPENDTYDRAYMKMKKFFHKYECDSDWCIITCDDCFLLTDKLEHSEHLIITPTPTVIGQIKLDCPNPGFRSGPGMAFNAPAMKLLKESDLTLFTHPEDVRMYDQCIALGIDCIDSTKTLFFRSATEGMLRNHSFVGMHPVLPDQMDRLWKTFFKTS